MPPAFGSSHAKQGNGVPEEPAYPSKNIAYQAAAMITSIIEALVQHDQLRYAPAFIVYSLFSALLMHVYQLRSANPQVAETTQVRLNVCMNALKDVSKVWLVGKMVHTLFESILGNKQMEERLQKASGKRHAKAKSHSKPKTEEKSSKRKFDEFATSFGSGQPAAQMSYERSRPVSPVNEDGQRMPDMSASSPPMRHAQDAFMGMSKPGTRANTPFNNFSYPGTPPDFFLHTRNSPNISQDLWQNYQPDQLFPPDSTSFSLQQSPQQQMMEPLLTPAGHSHRGSQSFAHPQPMPGQTPMQQLGSHMQGNGMPMQFQQMSGWGQLPMDHRASMASAIGDTGNHGGEETWSNSSTGGPIVPTTLNVGDWFEFFGIPNNGDMNSLQAQF